MRGWKSYLRNRAEDAPCGICAECGEQTQARVEDDSFSHGFGVEHQWSYGGSWCCDADVLEDAYVVNEGTHTAQRDHKDGYVKKGDYYSLVCIIHDGRFIMSKNVIKRHTAPNPHA